MPNEYKTLLADCIPEELYDKIATEEVGTDVPAVKEFLRKVDHPIITKHWKDGEPVPLKVPKPNEDWPDD
jgi:acetyl-CoA decarbonylase/synthase complex subunit beta